MTPKTAPQAKWLTPALRYGQSWLDFQMERLPRPGLQLAVVHGDQLVWQYSAGVTNANTQTPFTHKHRGRFASHSKTFTAAAVMLLRERSLISLDDPVGRYVKGLRPTLASARIEQLLSHSAGVVRDGSDSGQFQDRRPYLNAKELLADLKTPPPIEAGTALKYSNHGYGLLGLVIERVSKTAYAQWVQTHLLEPCGLRDTSADVSAMPVTALFANGHTGLWPYGRHVIPADNPCHAMAPAAGFVSTASDMARFYAQLSVQAPKSILSLESRREMIRRRWQDTGSAEGGFYGLGLMSGGLGKSEWFGHSGGFQGVVSRTAHFPQTGLTISALCNANDGLAWPWVDGLHSILAAFHEHGAPNRQVKDWGGRWWAHWGEHDLLPVGNKLLGFSPSATTPIHSHVDEFKIEEKDRAITVKASAYNRPGEALVRLRNASGKVIAVRNGGTLMSDRDAVQSEIAVRYQACKA